MPAVKKPADKRQRTNKPKLVEVLPFRPKVETPAPPRKLLKSTRQQWAAYWSSRLAKSAEVETDLPAIRRLYTLYDERERAYRAYREERLVPGSQNQMVLNPLARIMNAFDAEIRQLEDRLGLTPKARLQLGITLADAARSMRELNRSLEVDQEDPR